MTRPITPSMCISGARALYDQYREIEGRVEWKDAAPWVREPYELKARLVLEAAISQEDAALAFLQKLADECYYSKLDTSAECILRARELLRELRDERAAKLADEWSSAMRGTGEWYDT